MSSEISSTPRSAGPNKPYIGRMSLLCAAVLAASIAVGLGLFSSDPGFYSAIARTTWPLAIAIFGLTLLRLGRLVVTDSAVTIDENDLTLRFEPLRLRDRVISHSDVAHFQRVDTRYGDALEITLHDGRKLKIPDRFLEEPNQLALHLKAEWPDVRWLTSSV